MKKKVLSLLIALVMVLGMFPAVSLANSSKAFADEAVPVLLGVNVSMDGGNIIELL